MTGKLKPRPDVPADVADAMVAAAYEDARVALELHVIAAIEADREERDPAMRRMIAEAEQRGAEREREACARLADPPLAHRKGKPGIWRQRRAKIAASIRERADD